MHLCNKSSRFRVVQVDSLFVVQVLSAYLTVYNSLVYLISFCELALRDLNILMNECLESRQMKCTNFNINVQKFYILNFYNKLLISYMEVLRMIISI